MKLDQIKLDKLKLDKLKLVKLKQLILKHQFSTAITGVVLISIVLTIFSMTLYYSSGAHVLDLSRPGYEDARKIINDAPADSAEFSDDGPVNQEVISQFNELFDERRQNLKAVDDFSNKNILSDQNLHLTTDPASGSR